jgi:peptide/nickel transport system substrate-binding protein
MLLWQAPSLLNPHLAQGLKDWTAARVCAEPLITFDNDGKASPVLAAEVPSVQNGGVAADGKSVTYKLKPGVKWADGEPFSADDVVTTYQFIADPASASSSAGMYANIDKVEAVDPGTVKISFKEPTGGWFVPFSGQNGQILPKHLIKEFIGAKSREAPLNMKLVGTGPYVVDDFKPGDLVIYKANPNYRDASKVGFERIELKGGGDAVSAARAVFQTGELDYAWNLQVEAAVLQDVSNGGKGDLLTEIGLGVEDIFLAFSDTTKETNGERGAPGTQHPILKDLKVRQAMVMAIDRKSIAAQLYGPTGAETANVLTVPTSFASKSTKVVFDIDGANRLLDEAGYKRGPDGIRVSPDGVRLKILYQTTTNSLHQKQQAIVKDGWQKIGIDTELKSIEAGVFTSSDPSNPDTYRRLSADAQTFASGTNSPFPTIVMQQFYTGKDNTKSWSQQSNKWSTPNFMKFQDDEYDKLFEQVLVELNPEKAAQLWQQLNDIVINKAAVIPLVDRKITAGKAKSLTGPALRTFDSDAWNIGEWRRTS